MWKQLSWGQRSVTTVLPMSRSCITRGFEREGGGKKIT